jgi:UDP-glucose 4-epimerase
MRILVTGGAGFIGSHTAQALVKLGHAVMVFDNLSTGHRENVPAGCTLVEGDVRDYALIERCVQGQNAVLHLAAFTSVPESFLRASECFEVNVHGTLNVLEAVSTSGKGLVMYASSSAIYAEEPDAPKVESMCPEPASPYAVSKLEGEHLLEWYHRRRGVPYLALRYFNVFGPRQEEDSDYAAVIPKFITRSLRNETLTIHGDGRQTRDFVFIEDVVTANVLAVQGTRPGVYNVGTGTASTILWLAERIIGMAGSTGGYAFAPRPPGDIQSSTADVALISHQLGWRPAWTLERGLEQTLAWRRAQDNGGLPVQVHTTETQRHGGGSLQ